MDERLEAEEKQDLPSQGLNPETALLTIKNWYKESLEASREWRSQAKEDYDFYSGEQWSNEDKQAMREQLRPVIVFNRVGPVIDAIAGTEINNRQETRYIPREEGDVAVNELLTAAGKYFRDQCQAEDEESDAFLDLVICGMGWTQTRLSFDDNPEGDIVIERVDPLEMYWDCAAKKRNLTDGRYLMRVRDVSIMDARALAPDAMDEDLDATWAKDVAEKSQNPHNADAPYYEKNTQQPLGKKKMVRLVECEWWDREEAYLVAITDPQTGEQNTKEFSAEEYQAIAAQSIQFGIPINASKFYKKCFYKAICGNKILNLTKSLTSGASYNSMTGKRDRNSGMWYGIVRTMKDPQRWANKWLSQVLHIINSNAKGGIMAETDAFEDPRQAEENWTKAGSITWLSRNGAQKIQPKPQAQYPQGIDRLMEFAISSIRDTSGVNLELLGLADRQQPGVLEYQRRQSGITILAGLFDALRRYRKTQGKILLELITKYLNDGRLVRIAGEGYEKYVPLALNSETSNYDVIVDEAPSSPNIKDMVWQSFNQLLPTLVNAGLAPPIISGIVGEFIKYSPLPNSLGEKISGVIQEASASQPPDPQQQAAFESQMRKSEAETRKVQADAGYLEQKAQGEAIKNSVPFLVQ